ncbi:monooxygenase [Chloroflexia bacterium SDU3-3]|nr:monooxygenase [Chloroflexia bacterium SDU3-3]
MTHTGRHAVVIGASIGGLLAARVLSDRYEQVTLLERDSFPAAIEPRKGVPQGRHAHGLHARGRAILDELFPGFTQQMVAQGAVQADISNEIRWYANGGFHQPTPSHLQGLMMSRPGIEEGIRARVLALPNVSAIEQCDVEGIVATPDGGRVTGVRLVRRAEGSAEQVLEADLVVDASGRGSRSPAWLAALGYGQVEEERVKIDMGYTTRYYRRTPEQRAGYVGLAIAGAPPDGRNGVIIAQEGERWVVTLGGYNGDFAPLDPEGFLEFARTMPTPEIYTMIKDAEPITDPVPYRFPANQRRHYERLSRFPEGYMVFGDAICSFNPVYGQGITVAANEALALQACLAEGAQRLGLRFFQAIVPVVDAPWQVAVGNDLQLPHVEGKRTAMGQFISWYIGKVHIAARTDSAVSISFLEVVNMMAPATSLLAPGMLARVIRGNLAQRPAHAAPAPQVAAPAKA